MYFYSLKSVSWEGRGGHGMERGPGYAATVVVCMG